MPRRGENIYKRKDGRYEGRYVIGRTKSGKTRFGYVYGRQYSAVRDELIRRKSEQIARRGSVRRESMRLAECMQNWLAELRASIKPSSWQTYANLARKHVLPALGWMELKHISSAAITDFANDLAAAGLAGSTVKGACRLLCACMRYAQEEGYIGKNPCKKLRISVDRTEEQRVLSLPEQKKLERAAKESEELPVLLAIYTGMRLGEICALKWSDIDWNRSTICVCRTAQRIRRAGGGTMLIVDCPKTRQSRRVLPVPAFLLALLKQRHEETRGEYIFGVDLRPAEPRTIQRRFQMMMKREGISNVHFHTLRHSFATRLIEMGVDIKTVSTLLGHSSAKTTLDFYAHSRLDTQREAIEKLAAAK